MADSTVTLADGDKFLLKLFPANKYRLFTMRRNLTARFGDATVKLDALIGAVYGSSFEINSDGTMCRIEADALSALERFLSDKDGDCRKNESESRSGSGAAKQTGEEDMKDNRNLVQSAANQKMSHDELMKMKRSNVSAMSIVSKLMASSSTFTEKNALTKAKYVRKKLAKHARFVQLVRVCARTVYAYYSSKNRRLRLLGMRVDSVAQLLAKAAVSAARNTLLYDATCGFLTGCVLERVYVPCGRAPEGFQQGKVVQVFRKSPLFPEWSPQSANQVISFVSVRRMLALLTSVERGGVVTSEQEPKEAESEASDSESESGSESGRRNKRRKVDQGVSNSDGTDLAFERQRGNFGFEMLFQFDSSNVSEHAHATGVQCQMDALIVASKWPSGALVRTLLRFVRPGAPFVVFSPFVEAARDCFSALRAANCVAQLDLAETVYREWQVLPERTHPLLSMDASSGFIVSGFKLASA